MKKKLLTMLIIGTSLLSSIPANAASNNYIPSHMTPGTVIQFDQNKKMEVVKRGTEGKNLSSETNRQLKLDTTNVPSDLPTIKSNMTVVYDALGAPVVITPQSEINDAAKISVGMKEVTNSELKSTSSSYAHTQSGIVSRFDIWAEPNTASGLKAADGAAHKTIPLLTYVEVNNLDNGKGYTVWILDRGPYVNGRILDMSNESFTKVESTVRDLFNGRIFWN